MKLVMQKCFAYLFVVTLCPGCVTETVRTMDLSPPDRYQGVQQEAELLDIGIKALSANVPEDYDERIEQIVLPEIRQAESSYIAYLVKNMLESSGNWGAVRMLPRESDAVDLLVEGKILSSTGEELAVEFTVTDATGLEWFSRNYRELASKYGYQEGLPPGVDAFQGLYRRFADDLLAYRKNLDGEDLRQIRSTSEVRFAAAFAPDAFASALTSTGGRYFLNRLPAETDPLFVQVQKVKEREYLFIDTMDGHYKNFQSQISPVYDAWRKASYNDAIEYKKLRQQARRRLLAGTAAIAGSVAAIYESDNAFVDAGGVAGVAGGATLIMKGLQKRQEAAQYADKLREIGSAAEDELLPTTLDLENETIRLNGTLDEQYAELRKVLKKIYLEEWGSDTFLDADARPEAEHRSISP